METKGQRIKRIRKLRGLTQPELAKKVNVSPQVISNWEREYTSISDDDLERLSKALNVSTDYIIHGVDNFKNKDSGVSYEVKSERELLLEELEQYGNLAFEGGGEDLDDDELREIVQAMRDAAKTAARNMYNVISKFKK